MSEKEPHPKDEEIFRKIDHILAEETTIIEGLEQAVKNGWMSRQDAEDCLAEYIRRRNEDIL